MWRSFLIITIKWIYTYLQKIHKLNPFSDSVFSSLGNRIPNIVGNNPALETIKLAGQSLSIDNGWIKQLTDLHKFYKPLPDLFFRNFLGSDEHKQFDNTNTWFNDVSELRGLEYNLEDLSDDELKKGNIIKLVDNTKGIIRSVYENNELITKVNSRDFEKIIAELLYFKGYEVELTKRTRDGGYDVLALTKIGGIPFKILAECKRFDKQKVGIEIIRSFCDVINEEKANKGIIFTTSYFSLPARERNEQKGHILDFKDKDDVIEWIINYQEN